MDLAFLPQPHPRLIAIGELDAGVFHGLLNRGQVVGDGYGTARLEIADRRFSDPGLRR
jgi:hypothetical protein